MTMTTKGFDELEQADFTSKTVLNGVRDVFIERDALRKAVMGILGNIGHSGRLETYVGYVSNTLIAELRAAFALGGKE